MKEEKGAFKAKRVKQEKDKIVSTPRQRKLFRFLEYEGKINKDIVWYSAKRLAYLVNNSTITPLSLEYQPLVGKERYEIYTLEEDKVHNRHDPCSALRRDVEEINRNPEFDRVIICENNCYKLAERPEELEGMIKRIDDKLSYYSSLKSIIESKKNRNGQGKVVNNDDKPMTERCEQFHSAYGK